MPRRRPTAKNTALEDWQVSLIRRRLAEAEAGGATVPHHKVLRMLEQQRKPRKKLRD